MSPAVWVNRSRLFGALAAAPAGARVWIDVGGRESESPPHQHEYDRGYSELRDLLRARGCEVGGGRFPQARHHESAWARRLPQALRFLYG
jgi:predicted alpha/beta superfamily hydrolase